MSPFELQFGQNRRHKNCTQFQRIYCLHYGGGVFRRKLSVFMTHPGKSMPKSKNHPNFFQFSIKSNQIYNLEVV